MGELNLSDALTLWQRLFPSQLDKANKAAQLTTVQNQQANALLQGRYLNDPAVQDAIKHSMMAGGANVDLTRAQTALAGDQGRNFAATAANTTKETSQLDAKLREIQLNGESNRNVNEGTLQNQTLGLQNTAQAQLQAAQQGQNNFDLATQRQNAYEGHNQALEQQAANAAQIRALVEMQSGPGMFAIVPDPSDLKKQRTITQITPLGQAVQQRLQQLMGLQMPQQQQTATQVPPDALAVANKAAADVKARKTDTSGMPASNPFSQPSPVAYPQRPLPATPMSAPLQLPANPSTYTPPSGGVKAPGFSMGGGPPMQLPSSPEPADLHMQQFTNPALASINPNDVMQMIKALMQQLS